MSLDHIIIRDDAWGDLYKRQMRLLVVGFVGGNGVVADVHDVIGLIALWQVKIRNAMCDCIDTIRVRHMLDERDCQSATQYRNQCDTIRIFLLMVQPFR